MIAGGGTGFNGPRNQGGFAWLAPLIGLASAGIQAGVQKKQATTQARIAELQLMTEQKSIDAQIAASKAERDLRTKELDVKLATTSPAAKPSIIPADVQKWLPLIVGAFLLIFTFGLSGLRRK